MFDDNPILIDTTNSTRRNRKRKINCVIYTKVKLVCTNFEEMRYKCPRCKNTYQLGGHEIIPEEDILESSHDDYDDDDADNAGLLSADDEFNNDDDDDDESDSIPIPKYMQNSITTRVVEYREE